MSVTLRTNLGFTEAVIAEDGTLNLFYQVGAILQEDLRIKILNKEDEFDSISWDFKFKGYLLTLHYNIYNGISLFPARTRDTLAKDNKATVELANILEEKLLSRLPSRNIA
jgi:hypothetical protein